MSVKSDRWIKKMALEHGMIEPFESGQVHKGVISYGLSSYGYDLRVASDFKVFTNVHNSLVDPKNFDDRAFVDIVADYCIIPPNSFALARTVEYLRIPRNVVTVCVGKSTYARCFRGDTKVALVDGTAVSLEDMAKRSEKGEMFWGYSIGENGRMIVTLLERPRYIGRDSLLEVVLDNDQSIHCTPDHKFMRRDGRWVEAAELRPQDSLMPLYRTLARGYEVAYQPLNGHLYPTHRMADEWNLRHGIYIDQAETHRHHIDHDRLNNNPWNIERIDASEHIRYHNEITYGQDFDPAEHSESIKEAFRQLSMNPAWVENFGKQQRERAIKFWNDDQYQDIRERVLFKRRNPSEKTRQAHRDATIRRFQDPKEVEKHSLAMKRAWAKDNGQRRKKQAEHARGLRLRKDITAEKVRHALDTTGSIRGAARLLNCDRSTFRRFPEVLHAFRGTGPVKNHKVKAIRSVSGTHDVYCLTVPEAGNFALDCGIFVQNCGIIVNVTPFEPEWEGYATLEISNTTPLPAKVYANEGLCQVLFFESDEDCEVSYKDKKGKYQNQPARIVLPRMKDGTKGEAPPQN